jgi:Lrp/AsnC family leucine-responsive transcriptional regulator
LVPRGVEFRHLLHAFVRDLEHYRGLLGQLTRLEGIAHIQSSFVLKAFVSRGAPLVR